MGRTHCFLMKLFSFKATAFCFGLVWFGLVFRGSPSLPHRTSHHIAAWEGREGTGTSFHAKPGRVLLSPQHVISPPSPARPRPGQVESEHALPLFSFFFFSCAHHRRLAVPVLVRWRRREGTIQTSGPRRDRRRSRGASP